jgi:hypothetical protein
MYIFFFFFLFFLSFFFSPFFPPDFFPLPTERARMPRLATFFAARHPDARPRPSTNETQLIIGKSGLPDGALIAMFYFFVFN